MRFVVDHDLHSYSNLSNCACKFYCGSDAHQPAGFENYIPVMEKAVDMLGLTEDDKFIPKY